ncbi:MAG TPA: site-specific DNA-methyltransferase [Oscillatoriaceae cyanobacterium]
MPDVTSTDNSALARLRAALPEAFDGERVDWESLRALLGAPEPYGLRWPGRDAAIAEAEAPARGRLLEDAAASWCADSAEHRFYVGDNLDVLKCLRPELEGRVRVIYIDPPYNTGQGIQAYADNFRMGRRAYLRLSGQEADGEADGRRHAQWLSALLPRLRALKPLLRQDGVIFVSIDDREVHHLRLLMNEVFGAENFVASVIWRKKVVRGRGARHVLPQTEYVLVYARHLPSLPAFSEPLTESMVAEYRHADDQGPYKLIPLAKSGTSHSPRPNLVYPIAAPDGSEIPCPTHQWRWSRETLAANRDEVVFKQTRKGKWAVYTKQRLVVDGKDRERTPTSYYDRVTTTDGTAELKRLFGRVVLDFPKPSQLIKDLITWATPGGPEADDLILDCYAGSCATAQAVFELNAEDGGQRRFVGVQLAEALGDPEWPTIAEVGLERMRRVLARLGDRAENVGFRVWRLEDS